MKIPKAEHYKPEILEEHPNLEKAVKAAILAAAGTAIYSYFSHKTGVYIYLRPSAKHPLLYRFEIGHEDTARRPTFGEFDAPDDGIENVDESHIRVEDAGDLTAEEIQLLAEDAKSSGYQNPLQTD